MGSKPIKKCFKDLFTKKPNSHRDGKIFIVFYSHANYAFTVTKKEANANPNKAKETVDLKEVTAIINDRSKDDKNKKVFELTTLNSKYTLACLDLDSLSVWIKFLNQQVFGNTIHYGWLIKKGAQMRNWRKRFFVLSDFKELRYYEDETKTKAKGIISLTDVSIIRHGDKATYGYEYTIEIITPDRTWVLVTTYHELRELWMDKLGDAVGGGIRMKLCYEGHLWKFEDQDGVDWSKKYYGIDRETMNLYYVKSYNHFKQFASTLFFNKMYYLEAVDSQLQGAIPIKHSVVTEYGNNDKRFDDTSQKSNPWIFKVQTVLTDVFFACDTELQMKEWILHMNLAIGGVKGVVTIGGPDDYSPAMIEPRKSKTSDADLMAANEFGNGNNPLIEEEPPEPQYTSQTTTQNNVPKPPVVRPFGDEDAKGNDNDQKRVHMSQPKWMEEALILSKQYKEKRPNQVIIPDQNKPPNKPQNNKVYPVKNSRKQPKPKNQPKPVPPFRVPNGHNNGGIAAPAANGHNNMKMGKMANGMPMNNMFGMPMMNNAMDPSKMAAWQKQFMQNQKNAPYPMVPMIPFPMMGMMAMNGNMNGNVNGEHMKAYNKAINGANSQNKANGNMKKNNNMNGHMNGHVNGHVNGLNDKELNAAQDDINKKYNVRLGATELAFIANWTEIIAPFKGRPAKLEAQAAYPCAFDEFDHNNGADEEHDPIEIHEKCGCVHRISLIIDYYINWIYNKQTKNTLKNDIGMSNLISTLQDYSMTELLNDFFHIKRFHAEGVCNNNKIAPVAHFFAAKYGVCNIYNCFCLERNNRSSLQCRDLRYLRGLYYINMNDKDMVGTQLEIEEYVTQNILDMIHCYVFHGSYYSLYPDSTTPQELSTLREIYAKKKQHFKVNRFMTNIHSFHHIPYKPYEVMTPDGSGYNKNKQNGYDQYNPLMPEGPGDNGHNNGYHNNNNNGTQGGRYNNGTPSSHSNGHSKKSAFDVNNGNAGSKFDDATAMYEYTPSTFGVDMKYNKYQQALQEYGAPRFTQLKSEIMFNQKFALSESQFQILSLKAAILQSTFEGKLLKARKNLDSSAVNLDRKLFSANECMSSEMMQAVMLYVGFDDLRNDLMSTYYRTQHMNESEKDCRRRHYNSYYNWAKQLYTAIMAFGTDLYDNSGANKNRKRKRTYFYHNVSKPILFTNFNSCFFAPTSVTTSKNVAIIHMPREAKDGIVLELDTNNVDWTTPYYLNISMFGANPSECERIFCGGASLGIHNIISIYHFSGMSNLCNYTSAITLLRCIIGDSYNMAMEDDEFDYTELLDEFDQDICTHLEWLIEHQVDLYKSNKNINDFKNYSSDVPLYISLVLNAWCRNKEGIVQLNMNLLRRLPKPLQDKFVCESMDNDKDYSLNWSNLFNLFPKCSKIWMKGLYFNHFLCEKYVELLCSEQITEKKYMMNGIVFSCSIEKHWKEWVQTAKGHSSIIKQMGWLITASPPKTTAYGSIETGRVSFIKRMVAQ